MRYALKIWLDRVLWFLLFALGFFVAEFYFIKAMNWVMRQSPHYVVLGAVILFGLVGVGIREMRRKHYG